VQPPIILVSNVIEPPTCASVLPCGIFAPVVKVIDAVDIMLP